MAPIHPTTSWVRWVAWCPRVNSINNLDWVYHDALLFTVKVRKLKLNPKKDPLQHPKESTVDKAFEGASVPKFHLHVFHVISAIHIYSQSCTFIRVYFRYPDPYFTSHQAHQAHQAAYVDSIWLTSAFKSTTIKHSPIFCQPRSWNIQPCLRHVGTGTQSYGLVRTRNFPGRKILVDLFFWGLLSCLILSIFFKKIKLAIENWSKKIHFETQQSPSFMGNPYPKIPETPLVIHLYVLDSSGFHPAPINLISNSIWPSFDPRHRHRLLLSTRMRWGHHTDQRSQKLPQRHIDPMGLVSCWVSSWDVVFSDSY